MGILRAKAQIDQEVADMARWVTGNVTLDTSKRLLIYARQSSSKQYVNNIYSAMEQRDGLLERARELGWVRDDQIILFVENQLAKKTQVSGSLRIDKRRGLQALVELIESGKASTVLVTSIDRITRDPDLITPVVFAGLCKRYRVVIVVTDDEYTFDFNNPTRDDMGRFMNEAIAAKEYVRKQIKGKMLKRRTIKANMGRVANGAAPVGLRLDETRDNLVASSHASRVNWLYSRFRDNGANLSGLLREILDMRDQGIPLFPFAEDVDPKTVHLTDMSGGWYISTRQGLAGVLCNPAYAGHYAFNGRITKMNAHKAVVDQGLWDFAFRHLSKYELDNTDIEHEKPVVRYSQKKSDDTGALLAGRRHSGLPVIDGTSGAHVYIGKPGNVYLIKRYTGDTRMGKDGYKRSIDGFETGISIRELDTLIEARLLHWLTLSEKNWHHDGAHEAMNEVRDPAPQPPPGNTLETDLSLTRQELARVERALRTSQDVMSDGELRETYASQKRLDGWLRLTLVWSPIMGFIIPLTSSLRAVDVAYIWRDNGAIWRAEEQEVMREHYPTATREGLLHMLPTRSWNAILRKATGMKLSRPFSRSGVDMPKEMSLSDRAVIEQYGLRSGERLQWKHVLLSNDGYLSGLPI